MIPLAPRARVYADRASWLAARPGADRTAIGASEAGTVLGDGYQSPFEFWRRRMEGAEDLDEPAVEDEDPDDPLVRGARWEPIAVREYAHRSGLGVQPAGDALGHPGALVSVTSPRDAWVTASPDALVVDPELGTGGGEAKVSCSPARLWGAGGEELPDAGRWTALGAPFRLGYYWQARWQCEALDVPFVDLFVLLGSFRMRSWRILANPAEQRRVVDTVGEWRERHLVRGEAPDPDGTASARAWLSARWAADKERQIEVRAASDLGLVLEAYLDAKAREREAAAECAELGTELRLAMGSAYRLTIAGSRPLRGVRLGSAKPGATRALTVL
jgi:hypothetical protein